MEYGEPDGFGLHGILDDDGDRVLCHECGRWLGQLPYHLVRAHGMTAEQYRRAHGLSPTKGLVPRSMTAKKIATSTATYNQRPDIREHLAKGQTRVNPVAASKAAQKAAPDLRQRAAVKRKRSAKATRQATRVREEQRDLLDSLVRRQGYGDIEAWLRAHPDLTGSQIQDRLGISRTAARRLRSQAVQWQQAHRIDRMAAVGRVIEGERLREVASDAGVHPDTLRAWVVASPEAAAAARAHGFPDAARWLNARVRVPDAVREAAIKAVLGGKTRAEVARLYGVTDVAVGNWVRAARR